MDFSNTVIDTYSAYFHLLGVFPITFSPAKSDKNFAAFAPHSSKYQHSQFPAALLAANSYQSPPE